MPPDMSWRLNMPNVAGMGPLDHDAVLHARHGRRANERPPKPAPGDVVSLRTFPHGPLVEAVVEDVLEDENDPNTHQYVVPHASRGPVVGPDGERLRELVWDPWWTVRLKVVDAHGATAYVETREARLPGSPGWLPREAS